MDFTPCLESNERIYSHKIWFQAGRHEYASQGTYTCAIGENWGYDLNEVCAIGLLRCVERKLGGIRWERGERGGMKRMTMKEERLEKHGMLANVALPCRRGPMPNSLDLSGRDTCRCQRSGTTRAHRMATNRGGEKATKGRQKPRTSRDGPISPNPEIGMERERRVTSN